MIKLDGVEYWAMPAGYGGQLAPYPPRLIVIHKTDNPRASARGEATYAHNRPRHDPETGAGATSAHFYVDGIEVIGSLPLDLEAWAAHSYGNQNGWHIEICGLTGTFDTPADHRAAALAARLCEFGGIPATYLGQDVFGTNTGITGHGDLVLATGQGDHTDPGWTDGQWEQFINAVEGLTDMSATSERHIEFMAWRIDAIAHMKPIIEGGPEKGMKCEFVIAILEMREELARLGASDASIDAVLERVRLNLLPAITT